MNANSQNISINAPAQKVFSLVTNCNNFGKYIPPQITDFSSTTDYCQFSVNNMVTIKLIIVDKVAFSMVKFNAENSMEKAMSMTMHIGETESNTSTLALSLQADIPIFLAPMVKGQLQTFVDKLAEKIKFEAEK